VQLLPHLRGEKRKGGAREGGRRRQEKGNPIGGKEEKLKEV